MIGLLRRVSLLAMMLTISSAPAWGQRRVSSENDFAGAYAGVEVGAHEHHIYIEETPPSGSTQGRYYRAWGVGGGAFAGHDWAVSSRIRLGVEAGISLGGSNPQAYFSDGSSYSQHPQWGYRATGKAGYLLSDKLMAYGTFGYGGHKYRIENQARVAGVHEWGSSFTVGAGFEYRLTRDVGLRLDFRHLDNQMSHILVGIPIRF